MIMTSNIRALSHTGESTDSQDDDRSEKRRENEEKESSLCPFKLLWSFGINPETALVNLTTKNRTIIAYACSHTIMIYNYKTQEALPLQGHQNKVAELSTTRDGKWLMSADYGKDCAVVVWDTESGVPIFTLFNPHGVKMIAAAKISPNAKYIVTVGTEYPQKVNFWLWTYGKDEPDASIELPELPPDRIKNIAFNEDRCEEFALTAENNIMLCKWDEEGLKSYLPKKLKSIRRYGMFNSSCYITGTQRVLTATTNGYVLLWDLVADKVPGKSKPQATVNKEEKRHIKSVRLQKSNITAMLCSDGMIVVGTSTGRINFYDLNLKILYWWQSEHLDSIRSISFDLPSMLISPALVVSESELEYDEGDDYEHEGEVEVYSRGKLGNGNCDEKVEYSRKIASFKSRGEVSSIMTIRVEERFRSYNKNRKAYTMPSHLPTDATLENKTFCTQNFFVSCSSGTVALIDISALKCELILQNANIPVNSIDAHPRSNYIVTGNIDGFVCLYDYEKHKLCTRRKTPPLPDFRTLLDEQVKSGNMIYITCPQSNENLTTVTVVKYSPVADLLACGLQNGALWMLHPITLEPLDVNPYKHSAHAIIKVTFTECAEYMAFADSSFVVAVFKRNNDPSSGSHIWNLVGNYRSHSAPIREILFGPATTASVEARLFSMGEDRNIIEYDLKNSGPYPDPGLQILEIQKIECTAIPRCLAWYPQLGVEGFMMFSNSEHKYRLLNDITKIIRGTFLGPLYGEPVSRMKVLSRKEFKGNTHMIFATEKEIGLQILPLDGNPYKMLGMVGHPLKINNICVNHDESILFTSGYNDPCILMWRIKCKSVDVLEQLGGEDLSPYYCLLDGGAKGWLVNEMKDLFYYAQVLDQGENTTAPRVITETVSTKEIPNLMRAIGFYPSNDEIEILMSEIAYRNYAETGRLVEAISFMDFVKFYINHRPAFGISKDQLSNAFQVFTNPNRVPALEMEEPVLTRDQFINLVFGYGPDGFSKQDDMRFGEPLTIHEAVTYFRLLFGLDDDSDKTQRDRKTSTSVDFSFLPEMISYKDFTADIMGIELPEETRADDD